MSILLSVQLYLLGAVVCVFCVEKFNKRRPLPIDVVACAGMLWPVVLYFVVLAYLFSLPGLIANAKARRSRW